MSKLLQKLKGGKKGRNKTARKELEWMDFDEEEYEYEDEDAGYEDEEEYEYEDEDAGYEDEEEYEYEDEDAGYEDEEEYEYEDAGYEDEEEYEYEDAGYEDEEEYEYEDEDAGYEDEEEYEYEDEDAGYEDEEEYEYEDEDAGYEDEEEYEYEGEDDDDDEIPEGGFQKIIYKLKNLSATDYIISLTGVIVLALAAFTGTMYLNAKNNQAQIETFAEIGVGLESISMIGEEGLVAIADAQAARLMAATMGEDQEEQQEEEHEGESSSGKKEVVLNLTSIQKDLKIKFINKGTGKLVPSVAFEVEIEKPSGSVYTMKDEDKDGIIYQTGIESGKYKVKITAPTSSEEYRFSSEAVAITVRDTIEYKKVDVSDEVKTESQVNVAAEDTKVNQTEVESTNKDTVEWVESTKTLIEGTEEKKESYEKIDRNKIADPSQKAAAGFRLLAGTDGTEGEVTTTPEPDPTKEPEPTEEPEPTKEPEPDPTEEPKPEEKPTPEPTAVPTAEPTAVPTAQPTPTAAPVASPTPRATALPSASATPKATASPSVSPTPKATASPSPTATPNSAKTDTKSTLKSTSGETLYVKDKDGNFREAKYADYYNSSIKEFYRKEVQTTGKYRYTGWQEIDGRTYFFDKNGNAVTGDQIIQGAKYSFNSDGSLNTGSGHLGIDVSKHNGSINWSAVKNSGVSFVIIRCGYRGSSTGALIEDPMYRSNIQGALNAGLKVGIYFFTQAVNEVEAVEEASMVLGLIKGYNISYPVFLDVESSNGGRGDSINTATRTAVCKAFCQTIQNSGYKAGIYANKTWLNSYIDAPGLTGYKIWLAQYAAAPSYTRTKYDMWQYSSKGRVSGLSGDVDMNISYMGY